MFCMAWEKVTIGLNKKFKESRWTNTKDATFISVVNDGGDWRVWLSDTFGYDEELHPSGFKDEQSAKSFAKKYMRTH